jgi:hypothetical protein
MTKHINRTNSGLFLPDSYTQILSPDDMRKLITLTIFSCSYARMVDLGTQGKFRTLEPDEERDLTRLMQWYKNLGQDSKDKMDDWIYAYSRDTEDVSDKSGRTVDDANKRAMKQIKKWNANQ